MYIFNVNLSPPIHSLLARVAWMIMLIESLQYILPPWSIIVSLYYLQYVCMIQTKLSISISKTYYIGENSASINNLCHLSLLLKSFILCEYSILYFLISFLNLMYWSSSMCASRNLTHSHADIIIQHVQKVYLNPRAPHPVIYHIH